MGEPSSASRRPAIIIPAPKATSSPATLIFLHGYDGYAKDFNITPASQLSVAHHIHLSPSLQHVKVIIPESLPSIWPSVTRNVWYDLNTPIPPPEDPHDLTTFGQYQSNLDHIKVSLDYLEELIRSEIVAGTPTNRIVFMGYSMGSAVLMLLMLTRRIGADLGAIISYGTLCAVPLKTITRMQEDSGLENSWAKKTLYYMLHGKNDWFIPVPRFHALRKILEGYTGKGHGIATLEWEFVEGLRHVMKAVIWPQVSGILERVVPEQNCQDEIYPNNSNDFESHFVEYKSFENEPLSISALSSTHGS